MNNSGNLKADLIKKKKLSQLLFYTNLFKEGMYCYYSVLTYSFLMVMNKLFLGNTTFCHTYTSNLFRTEKIAGIPEQVLTQL